MKKRLLILAVILTLFIIPISIAKFDLDVNEEDVGGVIFMELDEPAVFNFTINNSGIGDNAEIYTMVGVSLYPKGSFYVPSGISNLEVKAFPDDYYMKRDGIYSIEYIVRGLSQGIYSDKFTINIVSLKDALEIRGVSFNPGDNNVNITIKNAVDSNLEDVKIRFNSAFFDQTKTISLKPFESTSVLVDVKEDTSSITAGPYIMNIKVSYKDASASFDGMINYASFEKIDVKEESSGWLIRRYSVTKINEGNVPVTVGVEMRKDILSRLFVSHSESPFSSDRKGFFVDYKWEKNLNPGESFEVVSTTNYTFPFILIVLIVIIALSVWFYTLSTLSLHKSVHFVKTAGGEFALKIRIKVKARKYVKNINIVDRIPYMAHLYDNYGKAPDRVDAEKKQLHWNIPYLNSGEERVFSYIIYSKLRAVGKFELPAVNASFEKDNGEKEHVVSNRAFFVSETLND